MIQTKLTAEYKGDSIPMFTNFIANNAETLDIFDEDYAKIAERCIPLKPRFEDFVEVIARRYSYDFDKFIDSMFLILEHGYDPDPIDEYINEQYLKSVN